MALDPGFHIISQWPLRTWLPQCVNWKGHQSAGWVRHMIIMLFLWGITHYSILFYSKQEAAAAWTKGEKDSPPHPPLWFLLHWGFCHLISHRSELGRLSTGNICISQPRTHSYAIVRLQGNSGFLSEHTESLHSVTYSKCTGDWPTGAVDVDITFKTRHCVARARAEKAPVCMGLLINIDGVALPWRDSLFTKVNL